MAKSVPSYSSSVDSRQLILGAAIATVFSTLLLIQIPMLALLLTGGLLLLFSIARVSSATITATAVLFSTLMVYRWDIGAFQISPYRLLLLGALVRITLGWITERRYPRLDPLLILLSIMIGWDLVGTLYSSDTSRGLQLVAQEIEFLVAYFVLINSVHSRQDFSLILKAFVGSVVIAIGLGFLQWINVFVLGNHLFTWPFMSYTNLSAEAKFLGHVGATGGLFRVGSVIGDAPNFAHLLALALAIIYGRWLLSRSIGLSGRTRLALALLTLAAIAMLLATWGRGGIVATLAGVLCLFVSLPDSTPTVILKRSVTVLVTGIAAAGLITLLSSTLSADYQVIGGLVEKTVADISDLFIVSNASGEYSFARRVYLQDLALQAWLTNPFLGVGTGGLLDSSGIRGVHNTWILRLAENGILGFLIIAAIYSHLAIQGIKGLKISRKEYRQRQDIASWGFTFRCCGMALFIQHLLFSLTWGYWWFPFYIITFALLTMSVSRRVVLAPPLPVTRATMKSPDEHVE